MLGDVRYLTDDQIELPRQNAQPLPSFEPDPPTSLEKDLRRTLRDIIRRGYQQRLLISTEGSVSARLDADSFLISPYRVDRSTLDLDDIVLVRNGEAEAGKTPSRASRNHSAIYDRYPQFHAIANAYTVNATAFSVTGAPLSTRTIPEGYIVLRDINRVPYGIQFTDSSDLARTSPPPTPSPCSTTTASSSPAPPSSKPSTASKSSNPPPRPSSTPGPRPARPHARFRHRRAETALLQEHSIVRQAFDDTPRSPTSDGEMTSDPFPLPFPSSRPCFPQSHRASSPP